jgi:hypothetical protein
VSLEEPSASEETKDDEEQNNTGNEMDNKAEESNTEMMDTSVPHENKEESINGKLKFHNICQVSLQVHMKTYSLIPVFVRK